MKSISLRIASYTLSVEEPGQSDTWNDIEVALTYPEYDVSLKNDCVLLVAITSDSGCGIHIVITRDYYTILTRIFNKFTWAALNLCRTTPGWLAGCVIDLRKVKGINSEWAMSHTRTNKETVIGEIE